MENKVNGNGDQKYAVDNYIISECNKSAWRASLNLVDSVGVKNSPLILISAEVEK